MALAATDMLVLWCLSVTVSAILRKKMSYSISIKTHSMNHSAKPNSKCKLYSKLSSFDDNHENSCIVDSCTTRLHKSNIELSFDDDDIGRKFTLEIWGSIFCT